MPRQYRRPRTIEHPTLLIAAVIHIGWAIWTRFGAALPWWLLAPVGGFLVAWHGSLQHETIHGHPTRSRLLNAIVGSAPFGVWLPYGIYREHHLAHHRAEGLTDPVEDPESFYVTREAWSRAGAVERAWLSAQTTAVGRLVLGPPSVVARFFASELRLLASGDRRHVGAWLSHAVGLAGVVAWLVFVCHMPLARYVLCFVYPGLMLTLLRSFAEHRPAKDAAHRIGIVEGSFLARLLYLNNNFHVVHHAAPALPWYELEARYRAERASILAENGGYVFPGYARIIARYALTPKDSPVHPG